MKSLKYTLSTLLLVLIAVTANAQQMYFSAGATQSLGYADMGVVVGENTTTYLTFSFDRQESPYTGIGLNYLKPVKGNIVSGFDIKGLVYQGLDFGGAVQFKSGYRISDMIDVTAGLEYLYRGNAIYSEQVIQPKLQISFTL